MSSSDEATDVPVVVRLLLLELDPDEQPYETHAARIFERVLTSGSIDAMRWLIANYDPALIAAWYRDRGVHRVSRDDVMLWKMLLQFDVDAY